MLHFFRQIRQRFLTDNKFSKYLLYAIGETLLVVMGILIALQVDNWNTSRQEEKLEAKILDEIRSNLQTGLSALELSFRLDSLSISSGVIILEHLENKLPFHDSLALHFARFPNVGYAGIPSSGYDAIKSLGLTYLSNDSIRIALSELYDSGLPYLQQTYQLDVWERRNMFYESELYEHFVIEDRFFGESESRGRYPINYTELLDDAKFISMVRSLVLNRLWFKSQKELLKEKVEQLLELINTEVDE